VPAHPGRARRSALLRRGRTRRPHAQPSGPSGDRSRHPGPQHLPRARPVTRPGLPGQQRLSRRGWPRDKRQAEPVRTFLTRSSALAALAHRCGPCPRSLRAGPPDHKPPAQGRLIASFECLTQPGSTTVTIGRHRAAAPQKGGSSGSGGGRITRTASPLVTRNQLLSTGDS